MPFTLGYGWLARKTDPSDARPCPLYQLRLVSTPPSALSPSPSPRYQHAALMREQAPMLVLALRGRRWSSL
jgi:hypothetical protein